MPLPWEFGKTLMVMKTRAAKLAGMTARGA
jgi:hypothetical protein